MGLYMCTGVTGPLAVPRVARVLAAFVCLYAGCLMFENQIDALLSPIFRVASLTFWNLFSIVQLVSLSAIFFIKIFINFVLNFGISIITGGLSPIEIFLKILYWLLNHKLVMSIVCYVCYKFHRRMTQDAFYRSYYTDKFKREPRLSPETVRNMFNRLPVTDMRSIPGHTHGDSAADRSAASSYADRFGANLGLTPYFYQCSRADERNFRHGSRSYYWAKDITAKPQRYDPPKDGLIVMVDVDYYIDMNEFLLNANSPVLLYSFQPAQVSRITSEVSYTFIANRVWYYVTGGAKYSHEVWNYSQDNLLLTSYVFGVPWKSVSYIVDRVGTCTDHELVLFTPTGYWNVLGAWLTMWLSGGKLERLRPLMASGFNRLESVSKQGVYVSTGIPGQLASANIKKDLDDAIYNHAVSSPYPLNLGMISGFVKDDKIQASVLLSYHRLKKQEMAPVICPIELAVRRYQYNPDTYEHCAKPTVVPFMTPIYDAAFAPDKSKNNEQQCIDGRITSVRNPELRMTQFLQNIMQEFVQLLIPEPHLLHPVDLEVVMDRQNRPTQRGIIHRSFYEKAGNFVKMFMKAECYANIKDPRPISTINGVDKVEYSKVIYAFEAVLKNHPWYAFSHTPVEIAERVAEVCNRAEYVIKSDFSRFDGHVSNLLRELERMALMRAFDKSHHDSVLELHNKQFKLRGIGAFGSRYDTDTARASGSPETSVFNSMENAFIAFLGLRRTFVSGAHLDANQAWECLGVYGGDDGLTANVTPKCYASASAMVGQELTSEIVKRGENGVQFLSRIYSPHVWFGDNTSICDVKRQLAKLHVTVKLPNNITPTTKLLEKARSFLVSDANTPVIGDYFLAVERVMNDTLPRKVRRHETDGIYPMKRWDQQFAPDVQYPNTKADWMFDVVGRQLPHFDYTRFRDWLDNCKTVEDLLNAPQFVERETAKSAIPVVADSGNLILGKPPEGKWTMDMKNGAAMVPITPRPIEGKWAMDEKPHAIVLPVEPVPDHKHMRLHKFQTCVPFDSVKFVDKKIKFGCAPLEGSSTPEVKIKLPARNDENSPTTSATPPVKLRGKGKFVRSHEQPRRARRQGKYPSNARNPNWRVRVTNGT